MKTRILIQDHDGKGSTTAWVTTFVNAINQTRQIAYDGQRWFVQANNRQPFKIVGESEVPDYVKTKMNEIMSLHRSL